MFHQFSSIGGAWLFSNERIFLDQSLLSFGKLRISYGTIGNDQIDNYLFLNQYTNVTAPVPYQGFNGLSPDKLPNPHLAWEETKKLQAGLDLGFFLKIE